MFDPALQTVPQLLAWRVRESPHATACCERTAAGAWQAYTWQQVAAQVSAVAAGLIGLGISPPRGAERAAIVAVLGRTSYTWWVIELATYHCGGVVAGLDPRLPQDRVHELLERLRPALVLTDDEPLACRLETAGAWRRATPRWLPPTAGRRWFALISSHPAPGRGQRADDRTVDGPHAALALGAGAHGTEHARLLADPAHAAADAQFDTASDACDTESQPLVPPPPPLPHAPATLLFTSGTSGPPKCLLFRHEQLLLACRSICEAVPDLGPDDATLCWLPLAHLFQRVMNLVAVAVGGSISFEPEPAQIMQSLREVEPTIFIGVPKFYERVHAACQERLAAAPWWRRWLVCWALARHAGRFRRPRRRGVGRLIDDWLDARVLSRLRHTMGRRLRFAITGSAPAPVWLLEFFERIGVLVLEAYGISENTVPLAANRPGAFCLGSVGQPMPGNELRISPDGEVQVRGGGVCSGYLNLPDLEPALTLPLPFTRDGFFRTGDRGRFDVHGYLHLEGRLNELVKVSTGRWLSPARMEQRYLTSPYIEQVVVFADARQPPVALIYPGPAARRRALSSAQGQPDPDGLRRLIAAELARLETGLEAHERLAGFALLEEPLSVAAGELTPLFKPRRAEIARRRAALLEKLGYAPLVSEAAAAAPAQEGTVR